MVATLTFVRRSILLFCMSAGFILTISPCSAGTSSETEHDEKLFRQYRLCSAYESGDDAGVPQDYIRAVSCYTKLANNGYFLAQYSLGGMYREGKGVLQDYKQAAYWYKKGAEQGHLFSEASLGLMYFEGIGVPKDESQAYAWLILASVTGEESMVKLRNGMADFLSPDILQKAQELAKQLQKNIDENAR